MEVVLELVVGVVGVVGHKKALHVYLLSHIPHHYHCADHVDLFD